MTLNERIELGENCLMYGLFEDAFEEGKISKFTFDEVCNKELFSKVCDVCSRTGFCGTKQPDGETEWRGPRE